jgi:hypothetical protein
MYGGGVAWSSIKQATTAVSAMDAEYHACGAAAREGVSLIRALEVLSELCPLFLCQNLLSLHVIIQPRCRCVRIARRGSSSST